MHSSLHASAVGSVAVKLLLTHRRAPLRTTWHEDRAPSNCHSTLDPLCRPRQRQPQPSRAMLTSWGYSRGSIYSIRAHSRHQHPDSQVNSLFLMLQDHMQKHRGCRRPTASLVSHISTSEKDTIQVYSWTIGKLDVFQGLSSGRTTTLPLPNTVHSGQYGIQISWWRQSFTCINCGNYCAE